MEVKKNISLLNKTKKSQNQEINNENLFDDNNNKTLFRENKNNLIDKNTLFGDNVSLSENNNKTLFENDKNIFDNNKLLFKKNISLFGDNNNNALFGENKNNIFVTNTLSRNNKNNLFEKKVYLEIIITIHYLEKIKIIYLITITKAYWKII